MQKQKIDEFSANLSESRKHFVANGSIAGVDKRMEVLFGDFKDPDKLRKIAGQLKDHTLAHLDTYLAQAEDKLTANGVNVHYAFDKNSAREQILSIIKSTNASKITKSKSMLSEEIELNTFLEKEAIEILETDLGEFIVQLKNDHPSHVVKPIIHLSRDEIAESLQEHNIGESYDSSPEVITKRARDHMRKIFMQSDITMTGGNFVSAESGRITIVTNEGNTRLGLSTARVHIALVGIEKLVPKDRDLSLFLPLLGRSATGQPLTVYTEFINGAKSGDQPDGPEEMHVVFIDNNRTEVLASDCHEILRCIRCGACMNVCPVYRQASGHAYRSVYPGPLGAVLSPLLAGKEKFNLLADLPYASSLCGACNEVCPVDIPIPDLLLKLRNKDNKERGVAPMKPFSWLATSSKTWRFSMKGSNMANKVPYELLPIPELRAWTKSRTLPKFQGGKFREWFNKR